MLYYNTDRVAGLCFDQDRITPGSQSEWTLTSKQQGKKRNSMHNSTQGTHGTMHTIEHLISPSECYLGTESCLHMISRIDRKKKKAENQKKYRTLSNIPQTHKARDFCHFFVWYRDQCLDGRRWRGRIGQLQVRQLATMQFPFTMCSDMTARVKPSAAKRTVYETVVTWWPVHMWRETTE